MTSNVKNDTQIKQSFLYYCNPADTTVSTYPFDLDHMSFYNYVGIGGANKNLIYTICGSTMRILFTLNPDYWPQNLETYSQNKLILYRNIAQAVEHQMVDS